ncbi:MAG: L-serine ammonia-lyase, iron-sulfur-dependent, subunit alpha [Blautia sp.]|nr:L-serine ammonia-lyase, iron-sulfur-dependent, subunit alpha [Blautia sp.]MDY5030568.1 L-serine ammonia-lyase, iron-sulfur-dependent, subunit alpha [Blautia sp.]
MAYQAIADMIAEAEEKAMPLWRLLLEDDLEDSRLTEEESLNKMRCIYHTMKEAYRTYDPAQMSRSGLVGGDGQKMHQAVAQGKTVSGGFLGNVMEKALKMAESNACMKRIVAAPTAGSCGVIPAVFCAYEEMYHVDEEDMIRGLYVCAGIGEVIAARAFLAGAAGGCQAEIGSASAMAAAGLTYLRGGSAEAVAHSCSMALSNLLGLVCDPVAGLVEVPCVKRNVIGAVNAVTSSDLAIAGIRTRIPPDEVIDAMKEVGESLPARLRETGEGGLAATPSGMKIARELW